MVTNNADTIERLQNGLKHTWKDPLTSCQCRGHLPHRPAPLTMSLQGDALCAIGSICNYAASLCPEIKGVTALKTRVSNKMAEFREKRRTSALDSSCRQQTNDL